jgi:hypothetical protein
MAQTKFYTENIGPIQENEKASFAKAVEICRDNPDIEQIILLIHTSKNTGYVDRVFSKNAVKGLFKGVSMGAGLPSVKIETVRTINDDGINKVIVAYGLRSDELFKLDDFENVSAIIAHHWNEDGVKDWAQTWAATEILSRNESEKVSYPDTVVQAAFKDLTGSINLSTGITHSDDNDRCKTYLRALNKYEHDLNPKEINAYLITELGWSAENAQEVIQLVKILNDGKYFQGGEKTGLQSYIKEWKSD